MAAHGWLRLTALVSHVLDKVMLAAATCKIGHRKLERLPDSRKRLTSMTHVGDAIPHADVYASHRAK